MKVDDWHGAYRDGWQGEIVPEAFAHPAKYSRSLIRRIYQHARDEGWLPVGSTVLDPFGGVALGALDAMHLGLNWCGVELEERFVTLGGQNIARWNARYSTLPGWGTATLIQGDSRQLAALLGEAAGCISSPPYAATELRLTDPERKQAIINQGRIDRGEISGGTGRSGALGASCNGSGYGTDPANLGNMKAGDFDACLASPPYAESLASDDPDKRGGLFHDPKRYGDKTLTATYGQTDGQLGAMPAGDVGAVISSPPYASTELSGGPTLNGQGYTQGARCLSDYGATDGQLGQMPAGNPPPQHGADGVVSSPPYEASIHTGLTDDRARQRKAERYANGEFAYSRPDKFVSTKSPGCVGFWQSNYGTTEGNVGNSTGDTFWESARTIVEQVYTVLRPGAHAIWVLKAYVRDRKIVDFPDQWRKMCEACGFETLHVHRAWLVEDHGAQGTLDGGVKHKRTERKSFFRRLAESKGSPRIDYEIVLCQVKPLDAVSDSGQASACVSSPPYVSGGHHPDQTGAWGGQAQSVPHELAGYGRTDGQLGNMKPGDFDAVLKPLNNNGKGDTQ